MNLPFTRRAFLRHSLVLGAGVPFYAALHPHVLGANRRLLLGIMGANSRGSDLARGFARLPDVEIACIADVDERAIAKGIQAVAGTGGRTPKGLRDFRQALADPALDALVIAAPDHWHGPATILACSAGKHVYVEKPASHNPQEGEWMIAAARRYGRVVQLGSQRRSMPWVIEAIDQLRAGAIGTVRFARGWYNATRGSIGHGQGVPVPDWLDWDLWQGPAPRRPYRSNLVHYQWHWFWHWGTGELGNNGIHALDLCRWGLAVQFPAKVTAAGGRYHFADDQETPDTQLVMFDFGDRAISWEGRSCQRHGIEGSMFGAAFYGDQGTLVTDASSYRLYDTNDKEVKKVDGSASDAPHLQNFVEAVRTGTRPNADIEEGHRSTLLCHLGNLAWRTQRTLRCDPRTGRVLDDRAAMRLWQRSYEKGWQPKIPS